MAAKHFVVVEKGVEGLVINPWKRELAEGKKFTLNQKQYASVQKAAEGTGIERYVSRLAEGKRVGLKGNNKVLAPSVRAIIKGQQPKAEDKPGNEVNKVAAPQQSEADRQAEIRAKRLAALEKARKVRSANAAARKAAATQQDESNTELVLDVSNTPAPRRSLSGQHLTIYLQMVEAELLDEAERFFNKFAS